MFSEMIRLAIGNVARSRLRYVLTTLGIMIGTGAIVSMVSYSVGMHRQISKTVASAGLLTTIYVLPGGASAQIGHDPTDPDDVGEVGHDESALGLGPGSAEDDTGRDTITAGAPAPEELDGEDSTRITGELIDRIALVRGVESVFPIVVFPAVMSRGSHDVVTAVSGLPAGSKDDIQKRLEKGQAFSSETDSTILITPSLARRLGIDPDSLETPVSVTLTVVTLRRGPPSLFSLGFGMPFERRSYRFSVGGILKIGMGSPVGRLDAYVPLSMAREIAAVALQQTRDILRNLSIEAGNYVAAEVHVTSVAAVDSVTEDLKSMGLSTFSISDQLREVRTSLVVLAAFLGGIGGVALFVGCLGIMNVMLISVFERTRDIGIMKSVGARRRDVLHLFMIEAGFIGVAGGVLGILLGWLIAEITNHIMFAFVIKGQMAYQRLYEIPPWLAGGAVALAILVSVLAGVYPARRAATLDPVAALRYE